MWKLILLTTVAFSGLVALNADEEAEVPVFPPVAKPCSDGEEWKTCVSGSCAETTCERRVLPNACTEDCNYGCYCSDGYYRNGEACVTLEHCPDASDAHHEKEEHHEEKKDD
ncbi:alpha-tectorin [Ixodes scapularis]|uniref:alpha-tectorin n=1 Tax=Ixodes scapularis TaxID=6945 RepID=UPI001C384420|nr:alpha-tectorin [Ixodes scapularis]